MDGFDQIVPTTEESCRFFSLLWRKLRYGTLQDLEGNSPIGPAANMGNGPDVFWGVPNFVHGFELYTKVNGQPNTPIATIAEFKQRLVAESEGCNAAQWVGKVDTNEHPFHGLIIHLKYILNLSTHLGAAIQKTVYVRVQAKTLILNGSELHISVAKIYLHWH